MQSFEGILGQKLKFMLDLNIELRSSKLKKRSALAYLNVNKVVICSLSIGMYFFKSLQATLFFVLFLTF